jgi:hypothetical protein
MPGAYRLGRNLDLSVGRGEVTGNLRRLHNKKLYKLYTSPNIIWALKENNEIGGACGTPGEEERCTQDFGG